MPEKFDPVYVVRNSCRPGVINVNTGFVAAAHHFGKNKIVKKILSGPTLFFKAAHHYGKHVENLDY